MLTILLKTYVLFGFVLESSSLRYRNQTCGIDKSKTSMVYEGRASIDDYPWMGTLFYPIRNGRMTTSVVLVTKQIVIGSAKEIDTLPKHDVRSRSRVVLGSSCTGDSLKIRDYALHPDYNDYPLSTLAMVQLEVDLASIELRPICSPPIYFIAPEFYAMVAGDCNTGNMRIFRMKYVPQEECHDFYRKSGLHNFNFWPKHTTCARAVSPRTCRWRSGAALVIKQDGRWRLLGFGLHGPGCRSPARFLDYGMQEQWVRRSVERIGLPAITRVGDSHLIVRRSLNKLQRFGACDMEEQRHLLYNDEVNILGMILTSKASYNLTLLANTEYSCIILRTRSLDDSQDFSLESTEAPTTTTKSTKNQKSITTTTTTKKPGPCRENPMIYLRRWCAGSTKMCYGFQFLEINFFVDIISQGSTMFTIAAYGNIAKIIDPGKALADANHYVDPLLVKDYPYADMLAKLIDEKNKPRKHEWFYGGK